MSIPTIVGGGLAGLITACAFKNSPVFEAGPRVEGHKALLRFRDRSVSELTGISFREVTVRKEIYYKGAPFHTPTISMANQYSQKVVGLVAGRSVWDLDTVKRYVAPPDFYDQLADRLEAEGRIHWDRPVDAIDPIWSSDIPVISTIPLPAILRLLNIETDLCFKQSSIQVDRWRIKDCDVYQTIYFPDLDTGTFRASITGDVLIIESLTGCPKMYKQQILRCFGIFKEDDELLSLGSVDQKFGKIVEIGKVEREAILYELTRRYNVFSIGRFATWRNILLDDVVKDIAAVQSLMRASEYGRFHSFSMK